MFESLRGKYGKKHYIQENHNISGITSKVHMQPAVMIKVINKVISLNIMSKKH